MLDHSSTSAERQIGHLYASSSGIPYIEALKCMRFDSNLECGMCYLSVHEHFLQTNFPVFRGLFRRQPRNIGGNEKLKDNYRVIHLNCLAALEFESLLAFFYRRQHPTSLMRGIPVVQYYSGIDVFIGWRDDFSMPIASWMALLSIGPSIPVYYRS